MAGYETGEGLLLTLIRTVSGFTSTNTAAANSKILNQGRSSSYVLTYPGPFEIVFDGMGGARNTTWITYVEVWERYKDDSTTKTALMNNVRLIRNKIDATPRISDSGDTITDTAVIAGDEPVQRWVRGGNRGSWLVCRLTCRWTEKEVLTIT